MKLSLVLVGMVITLLVVIVGFSFSENVFAQSENKNLNENSNVNPKNNDKNNFDGATVNPSSETASTIGNKYKEISLRYSTHIPKVDNAITRILENANPKAIAKLYGAQLEDDSLFVYVYLDKIEGKPSNIEVLAQDENIIVSKLNLNQIKSLTNFDSVKKITLPDYAKFYVIDESEGVQFSFADKLHLAGFDGTGVTVAVIDAGFITNNTQISGNIVSGGEWFAPGCGDMACGNTDGASHGTAVAEIVVDMAPNVGLRLYSVKNSIDFNNAVDHAIANGADIITASLGFPGTGGDGTNVNDWFRDGTSTVAKKINNAKSNGVLATIAAGNQGSSHWMGSYVPLNATELDGNFADDLANLFPVSYQSVMLFNSTATGNMRACLPINDVGTTYQAAWNAWPSTNTQDYDLMLYSADMTAFKTFSDRPQVPNNLTPIESFGTTPNGDTCLVIASYISDENHFFHVDIGSSTFRNQTYMIPAGSIDTPADATGALTVGAVSFNSTITDYTDDFLESFSSQGPTDDSRLKPEICGPDRNFTHQTNLNPSLPGTFPGTSAATPHVAGAAALLLQQDPSLTVDQLKQKLIDNARFDADFSVDNKCGSDSGSLQLPLDVSVTIVKTANGGNAMFDFTTTSTDTNLDGNFTGNGGFTINTNTSNSMKFTGMSPAVNYTITESPESGWKFDSVSCSGSTASISGRTVTIDPIEAAQITCTFTNTKLPACTPPDSGNWVITSSCILNSNHILTGGNVIVQNNSILEIPNGITLDLDFASHNLTVKSGSGVLIKSGGKIT